VQALLLSKHLRTNVFNALRVMGFVDIAERLFAFP
jgi:hypothetical protein